MTTAKQDGVALTPAVVNQSLTTREMVAVDKARFYALIGPRNVHPRPQREHTEWIDLNTHAVIGVSTPGYANTYADGRLSPVTYALSAAIAAATGGQS